MVMVVLVVCLHAIITTITRLMGIATLAQLRQYLDQVPRYAQQTVTITGDPDGGTLALGYGGQTTSAIARSAAAAVVQAALAALANVGANNVAVTGPNGGPWAVSFTGQIGMNAAPLSLAANNLTGGDAPDVAFTLTTDATLQACLDRAESIVTGALGFTFFADGADWDDVEPSAKRVQSEASKYLKLPPYHYGSIDSLVEMNGATAGTFEITDYEETEDRFHLYRATGWGGRRYQVTAQYGYGPAPASVVELILELAVNEWRSRDKGLFSEIIGVQGGGGAIKYVGGLNSQQQMIVANVRRQFIEAMY